MHLSKDTVAFLKNASQFNGNFLIKAGTTQSFLSAQRNVVGTVVLQDEFPTEFGIYDLNEFLGVISLFDNPELEFDSKAVRISENGNSVKFFSADSSVLTFPKNSINFPEAGITFNVSNAVLSQIQKTASVLRATDVAFIADGSNLTVVVADKKNPTGNSFSTSLLQTDKNFTVYMKVDNLKLMQGDYVVEFASAKRISRWTNGDLNYVIAVEADSTNVE